MGSLLRKTFLATVAALALVGIVSALASAATKPAITFVSPSPAEGETLTTNAVEFKFTYNKKPSATKTLTCALSGPTPKSGCDPANPAAFGTKGSQSGASYSALANGEYTFTVSLTLTDVGTASATRHFTIVQPAAPTGLHVVSEGNGSVGLSWSAVPGVTSYNVYRSSVSGGGYVKANGSPVTGTSFSDTGLQNAHTYYYVVRSVGGPGNESGDSNEVAAMPHLTIGWANLQWPPTMIHTISAVTSTDNAYGQVWIDGVTNQPGPTESLRAQLGFGPDGSNPASDFSWMWVDATFNVDAGNNDEFVASLLPEAVGTYDYVYRYSTTDGRDWVYADLNGPIPDGSSPSNAGSLTVTSSGDTTSPAVPTGLHVVSASPTGIALAWNPVSGDPSLYGYEVLRAGSSGGPYTLIARVTATSYTDLDVVEGNTFYYVVRSVDLSFNRSGNSGEVSATSELRTVTLVFNVTVPATTDGTGRSVYIAGDLDRLDPPGPQWDPGGVVLTRVDATHWTITLAGKEGMQIEYKYTLGSWDFVEKDPACGEIANRQLILSYGANGTQTVNDTVSNWRNVAPCGA